MVRALFIHRSVGNYLIRDGNMRKLAVEMPQPFALSDYMQNSDTLTDGRGIARQAGLHFPGNDTKPRDYAQIFTTDVDPNYKPIRDLALAYDVVIIKSCYPNSNILSANELSEIQGYYRSIINFFRSQSGKKLIIITSPPQIPLRTTPSKAKRARQLATWLKEGDFLPNVYVFNFFDMLADPKENWLKKSYRRRFIFDAHPNAKANREIAPHLIRYISDLLTT